MALSFLLMGSACGAQDDDDPVASTSDTGTPPATGEEDGVESPLPSTADESGDATEPLADGEACVDDDECVGACFFLPMFGGTCGECSADADCPGGGCSPPGFSEPPSPVCNDGSLSSACESDDACQAPLTCTTALDLGTFAIAGCSECTTSDDCEPAEHCNVELEIASISGYRQCVAEASVEIGRTCADDLACATGICTQLDLMGTVIGVCSECREDTDCDDGRTCRGALLDMTSLSLVPGQCE